MAEHITRIITKQGVKQIDYNALANLPEIPSVEGLAAETYVDEKIAAIEIPSVEGLATETYVDEKFETIKVPSIEGLATEAYVDETINTLAENGQIGYGDPAVTEKVFECTIPADGSAVRVDGTFSFRYDAVFTVTVDGKTYDCSPRIYTQGENFDICHVDYPNDNFPLDIHGRADGGNGMGTFEVYYFDVKYKNPNEHDADGHVIVEIPIKEATIVPIDPKFIPAMDSLTLNGADNKQHELAVDTQGVLTISVEGENNKVFATTDYVDEQIATIPAPPTKTSELTNDSGFLTEHQSLEAYALKSEVPSIQGLATETYVDNKVSALVNSAPEALNTLNELAAALGNDENFANTIMELIGQKAQVQIITWEADD